MERRFLCGAKTAAKIGHRPPGRNQRTGPVQNWRTTSRGRQSRSVLDCGSPLPLFLKPQRTSADFERPGKTKAEKNKLQIPEIPANTCKYLQKMTLTHPPFCSEA